MNNTFQITFLQSNNVSNYFHCPLNDACIYAGINSFDQGLSNMIFSASLIPFILYYIYMTLKLSSLKRDIFTVAMISLTILIICSLLCSLGEYLDYILFCSSDLLYNILYFIPLLFTIIIIYLFDYILCKGLSFSQGHNDSIKVEIEKKIYYIIYAKLPFLVLYVIIFVISFINFKIELINDVFNFAYAFYSIIYLFLYCIFLLFNLNFVEEVIKNRSHETYNKIHSQMFKIKTILGIHFFTRIIWETSLNVVGAFIGNNQTWYNKLSTYCITYGCIWHLLIIYIYKILIDLDIYVVFGLFIQQFVSTHHEMESIIDHQKDKFEDKLYKNDSFSSISLEELIKDEIK